MRTQQRSWAAYALASLALVLAAWLVSDILARTQPGEYLGNKINPAITGQSINASGGADTNFILPADCIAFSVNERTAAIATRIAYASGGIAAGNYLTLPAGERYVETNIDPDGSATTTIYLRSDAAASTVEIITWDGQ